MQAEKNNELYIKLKEAYTDINLNKIAHNLICLYREKQYDKLQYIAEMVLINETIGSVTDKHGFSKLISVYHPDRIQYYRNELEKYEVNRDQQILIELEHILQILDIEEIVANIESYENIDYDPEFMWDIDPSRFTYFNVHNKKRPSKNIKATKRCCTFYDAMKSRMNGSNDLDFPFFYFENMEEVEISQSRINNLDGIEYCIHTTNMDLSGNLISDLTPLLGLKSITELNLSDNRISDIDVLSSLHQLRSIDLSNNPIDDLSPLFNLELLEYIDVTINHISHKQIEQLEDRGVVVNIVEPL